MKTIGAICYIKKLNKILIQKRSEYLGYGKYSLPGGTVELNENPKKTIIREIYEETGLKIDHIKRRGKLFFYQNDKKDPDWIIYVFSASSYNGKLKINYHEGVVEWAEEDNLPFNRMFDHDKYWLPLMEKDNFFQVNFYYDKNFDRLIRRKICKIPKINTQKSILLATDFLFSHQNRQGMWEDFRTDTHENSVDWVTAYVGNILVESGVDKNKLSQTALFLSRRQHKNGGFSYNRQTTVPDSDSTSFAILFLSHFGYNKQIKKAIDFLLMHQKNKGGFVTFLPELIKKDTAYSKFDVSGWCGEIPEVTALAIQALKKINKHNVNSKIQKAIQYLLKTQLPDGRWHSYWWNSDIYATSKVASVISDKDIYVKKTCKYLSDEYLNLNIPFYLALCLNGLILCHENYNKLIDKGVKKIIKLQQNDGGWESYPSLTFPLPSDTQPWKGKKRRSADTDDQNRIFTTATCLQVLSLYAKI
ncbi:MAG: hypothetical protein C0412_20330 [Flavobacterium sp.]|nr:hypothetical protein [Flavobacterium sp.]